VSRKVGIVESTVDELLATASRAMTERRFSDAIAALRRAVDLDPGGRAPRLQLGRAYFKANDFARAHDAFQSLLQDFPRDANVAFNLATAFQRQDKKTQAIQAAEYALAINPDFSQAQKLLDELRDVDPTERLSLAQVLDDKERSSPSDNDLAGAVIWQGRPWPRLPWALICTLVVGLTVSTLLHRLAIALPAGAFRAAAAQAWRATDALLWPLVAVLLLVAVLRWLTTVIVVRTRRVEQTSGLLIRTTAVVWYYEIEWPIVLRQNLFELIVGIASIELNANSLSVSRPTGGKQQQRGRVRLGELSLDLATELSSNMRARSVWERRRMLQSFIASK